MVITARAPAQLGVDTMWQSDIQHIGEINLNPNCMKKSFFSCQFQNRKRHIPTPSTLFSRPGTKKLSILLMD